MRQSLITVGFFVGILSLPVAVAAGGNSLTKSHQTSSVQETSVEVAIATTASTLPPALNR